MKSMSRRANTALVMAFLTLGASSAFGAEKAHGCCQAETSCCSSACCAQKRTVAAYDQTAERFKAKFGREYPGKRSATQAASQSCCNCCNA